MHSCCCFNASNKNWEGIQLITSRNMFCLLLAIWVSWQTLIFCLWGGQDVPCAGRSHSACGVYLARGHSFSAFFYPKLPVLVFQKLPIFCVEDDANTFMGLLSRPFWTVASLWGIIWTISTSGSWHNGRCCFCVGSGVRNYYALFEEQASVRLRAIPKLSRKWFGSIRQKRWRQGLRAKMRYSLFKCP